MKNFQFNSTTLKYDEIPKNSRGLVTTAIVLIVVCILLGMVLISQKPQLDFIILKKQEIPFSEALLRQEIKHLNLRFEDILVAQTRLETGEFTSNIYLHNNNLFGMKRAYQRPKYQDGEANGHACYTDWKQSLIDMALFQASFCKDIKTEQEYLQFLDIVYAEDSNYVKAINRIRLTK